MKIGTARFAADASSARESASARKVDRARIPASGRGCRKPACRAIAPPWENPASTIRDESMPRAISRSTRASRLPPAARIPASSMLRPPKSRMSNQARMGMPPLIVTGRTGAFGKTKRTPGPASSPSIGTIGTKSLASAPRPCSQMTAAPGVPPTSSSTVSNSSAMSGPPSGTRCRPGLFDPAVRQGIGRLVAGMPGMAPDPTPLDPVTALEFVEFGPEVGVLDRLAVGGLPATRLPATHPFGDALLDVLRIGVDDEFARPAQGLQRPDDREQFHPVVGRVGLAPEQLLAVPAAHHQGAPAAHARIALAGAVGIDVDKRHGLRR